MKTKSTVIAYLLWFFFGLVGAHNFYLGKWIWGFFYLALTVGMYAALYHAFPHIAQNPALPAQAIGQKIATSLMADPVFRAAALGMSVLNLFMLWDLFTLWLQVRRYGEDR